VQLVAVELLTKGRQSLEAHIRKWNGLKRETEEWLNEKGLAYFPNKLGITYWVRVSMRDTYRWTNEHAIPHFSLAAVPGTFFLFKGSNELIESNMIRLSLGNIDPETTSLAEALETLERALELKEE
jgi:hypothetical protein